MGEAWARSWTMGEVRGREHIAAALRVDRLGGVPELDELVDGGALPRGVAAYVPFDLVTRGGIAARLEVLGDARHERGRHERLGVLTGCTRGRRDLIVRRFAVVPDRERALRAALHVPEAI